MPNAFMYTAQVPAANTFDNTNLNPLGTAGDYAGTFGYDSDEKIRRIVREVIYDSTPKQFLDLSILSMKTPEQQPSDEFFYHEIGFGREPLVTTTLGTTIAAGTTQSAVPVASAGIVSVDTIISYNDADATKGIITAVDLVSNTVDIAAYNGSTLPELASGAAYTFSIHSPVEGDGANSISQYYRVDTIERSNYVQMLIKAVRFGRMEAYKYANARNTQNFMDITRQKMLFQFRVDLANIYWNGQKGEVTLSNGQKAKTAGGIMPIMTSAGSPHDDVLLANLPDALEDLVLDTEFGSYGETKFLYGAPRALLRLAQEYKSQLTQYTPNDMVAKLGLKAIDMESTKVVFVPVKRFEESSCFPEEWASKLILLDQESITPAYVFPEEMGVTGDRSRGFYNNYTDEWISATASIIFNNPLSCGWLDVTDLI